MSQRIFCYLGVIGLLAAPPAMAQLSGGSVGTTPQQARISSFPDGAFLEGRFNGDPEAIILRNRNSQSVVLFEHDDLFDWDKINYRFPSLLAFGVPVSEANVFIRERDSRIYLPSRGQKEVEVTYLTAAPYQQVVNAVLQSTGLKSCYRNSIANSCSTSRKFTPAVSGRSFAFETSIVVTAPRRASDRVQIDVTYPATFELINPGGSSDCC